MQFSEYEFFFLINNFSIENRTKQIHLKITQEEDLNDIRSHIVFSTCIGNYMEDCHNSNLFEERLINYPIILINSTIFNISNSSNSIYQ